MMGDASCDCATGPEDADWGHAHRPDRPTLHEGADRPTPQREPTFDRGSAVEAARGPAGGASRRGAAVSAVGCCRASCPRPRAGLPMNGSTLRAVPGSVMQRTSSSGTPEMSALGHELGKVEERAAASGGEWDARLSLQDALLVRLEARSV